MATPKTAVLEAHIAALEARLVILEELAKAAIARRLQPHVGQPAPAGFPLVDKRGRHYRQHGNVRTFAPGS